MWNTKKKEKANHNNPMHFTLRCYSEKGMSANYNQAAIKHVS